MQPVGHKLSIQCYVCIYAEINGQGLFDYFMLSISTNITSLNQHVEWIYIWRNRPMNMKDETRNCSTYNKLIIISQF